MLFAKHGIRDKHVVVGFEVSCRYTITDIDLCVMTLGEEHVVFKITVVRLLCRDIDDENRAVSGMSDSGLLGAHGYVVVFSG